MKVTARLLLFLMVLALLAACGPAPAPAPAAASSPGEPLALAAPILLGEQNALQQSLNQDEPPPFGPPPAAAAFTLAGTDWLLSSLDGALPVPGTVVTLQFGADGSASGSDGCNQFNTAYIQDGETLFFSQPGASTMMACAEEVMAQATAFQAALAQTNAFIASERQLILRSSNAILATFVAVSQDLAGTMWRVTAYNNGRDAVVGLIDGSEISLDFGTAGDVSGNAGCNQYFANVTTLDGTIAFGPIGATFRFCDSPPGVMEQESEYLAALASAATYSIRGNTLEMRTAADQLALWAERVVVVELPTPAPAVPWGRVTATQGVNVRSGPGTNFPVIGVARNGDEGEIVGRSTDNRWWATRVSAAPNGIGWLSADFVIATDTQNVPVIEVAPPPIVVPTAVPVPPAPPTPPPPPTATPSAQMSLSAERSTINQGECTNIRWSVENVQAVWVYPQGERYYRFPRTGQGSERVCPSSTQTWEMRVVQRDGSVAFRQATVNVTPRPATPVPPASDPLAGTRWDVTSFNNGGGAVVTPLSGSHMTADFNNGQVSGSSGCNTFAASYSVNANNINIGSPSGGMMMCSEPAGVMEQEAQFRAALQSAATFRITGNTLEMRTAGGQIAVTLNRAP